MNKLKKNSKPLIWFMGLLLAGFIAGCGSDGGGSTQPGTLGVSMTDAPACGFDEVNVTVDRVRVHQSSSVNENAAGWTEITLNPPRTINLLNLNDPTQPNFALENLGETPLAAGHYTQLRLVLVDNNGNPPSANWIVLAGQDPINNRIPLETPSAIRSGIKLIHQFTVGSGQRVDLLLDFDACHSIVQTGNGTYKLKPVIKVIPFELNGIEGFVDPALFANQPNVNNNVNNVVVSAQRDGEIVRASMPNSNSTPNLNRGKFFLAHLAPGVTYDVVITADGHTTTVIATVPVQTDTSITTISTSAVPFTLQTSTSQSISGTATLDPTDDDGTVIVAAKQTLNGGPIVIVKSQVAALKTNPPATPGDYEYNLLSLPTSAPSRGLYGPLPIPLSATQPDQSTVAGMYTVHGSAQTPTTVYTTQTPSPLSVNITGGSAIDQNFTLTTP
jgi:hypothetical protein